MTAIVSDSDILLTIKNVNKQKHKNYRSESNSGPVQSWTCLKVISKAGKTVGCYLNGILDITIGCSPKNCNA